MSSIQFTFQRPWPLPSPIASTLSLCFHPEPPLPAAPPPTNPLNIAKIRASLRLANDATFAKYIVSISAIKSWSSILGEYRCIGESVSYERVYRCPSKTPSSDNSEISGAYLRKTRASIITAFLAIYRRGHFSLNYARARV